jgi:hypothetical protein
MVLEGMCLWFWEAQAGGRSTRLRGPHRNVRRMPATCGGARGREPGPVDRATCSYGQTAEPRQYTDDEYGQVEIPSETDP